MKNPGLEKFPLGFWCTLDAGKAPSDQPKEWAEMGMSLTMGHRYNPKNCSKEHFRAMLDCAAANGVKIILCDERTQARQIKKLGLEAYTQQLKEVISDWGDHPAIWGAHMGDEPKEEDYDCFITAIHLMQKLAPQWQPYANLFPWHPDIERHVGFEYWSDYLNAFVRDSGMKFLSYDCYTQMRSDSLALPIYFRNLKLYGDASRRNNVPFWTILLSIGHFKYRTPSLDDFRWQLNTAVAHGAKGISWFFIYQQDIWSCNYRNGPVNELGRKTQSYYDISDVQNIFCRTIGPVIDKLEFEKVYHIGHAFGGNELFTGDGEVAFRICPDDMIMSYFKDDIGQKYILLVNNSCTESVFYELPLKGENTEVSILLRDNEWKTLNNSQGDDGTVTRGNGIVSLPHWYAPGQAILYRYRR